MYTSGDLDGAIAPEKCNGPEKKFLAFSTDCIRL